MYAICTCLTRVTRFWSVYVLVQSVCAEFDSIKMFCFMSLLNQTSKRCRLTEQKFFHQLQKINERRQQRRVLQVTHHKKVTGLCSRCVFEIKPFFDIPLFDAKIWRCNNPVKKFPR